MKSSNPTRTYRFVGLALIASMALPAFAWSKPLRFGRSPLPASLSAQTPASSQIDVLVIEASNGPGGVDAALRSIPQLSHPPFSAYTQLTLVNRTTVPLGPSPSTVPFGSGDSVTVTTTGARPTGRADVSVQLTRAGRTHDIHFGASPNTPFFTAVSTGPSTAIVLGFIVH